MYTGCVDSLYRGRRGPPYRIGNAGPFGTSRYEANLYIVKGTYVLSGGHLIFTFFFLLGLLIGISDT